RGVRATGAAGRAGRPRRGHAGTRLPKSGTWKSGNTARCRSASVIFQQLVIVMPLAARLLCDSTAPFAAPVVPEVYTIIAGASPSSGTSVRVVGRVDAHWLSVSIGQSVAPSGYVASDTLDVTTALGSESETMWRSSRSRYS